VSLSAHSPTLPTGYHATTQLSAIESDLVPSNIVAGANIFGVQGIATGSGNSATSLAPHSGKMSNGTFNLYFD
jgi:hypothetical protein